MENQIVKVFENEEFGRVRAVLIDGEPWFVGKDVAMTLGYANYRDALVRHIDSEDKIDGVVIHDSIGRPQKPILINESGVYSLIFGSNLLNAKFFKRWVTSEVLPTIRKTGTYQLMDSYMIDDPVERAKRWIEEQEEKKALERKIEEDKPKVEFADHVADTSDLIDMSTLAKLAKKENIKIGRNRLFEWLRDNKYLMSHGKHKNEPYQKYVDNGWFVVREYTYNTAYGEQIGTKTYVTGKGQMGIIEKLRKDFM